MPRMAPYPADLEAWWLKKAEAITGKTGRDALAVLERDVAALSDGFTVSRGNSGYADSAAAWIAYGLFYFPQTYARMSFILRELLARGWNPRERLRALDMGAGTGAAACAVARFAAKDARFTLVDRSSMALEFAAELLPGAQREKGDLRNTIPKGPFDLVTVSYALNEAFGDAGDEAIQAWLSAVTRTLDANGVLIVCEPVVQSAGQRMDRLRGWALESGLRVLAPCLHEKTCPLAARGEWCHDVRGWIVPETARFLNRKLFRSVEDLKFSFLALGKSPLGAVNSGPESFRMVAPVEWLKGKWRMTGCAADGELRRYEVLKRGLGADARHGMDRLERGDLMSLRGIEAAGEGVLRGEPPESVT